MRRSTPSTRSTAQRAEVERFLAGDMRTQASRLVLSDGLKALAETSGRVETVRWDELTRRDADAAAAPATLWLVLGALAAASLVVAGLLLLPAGEAAGPRRRRHRGPDPARPSTARHRRRARSRSQLPRTRPLRRHTRSGAVGRRPARRRRDHVPEAGATLPQIDRRKAPELRAAADLCTDFARLVDGQEMPALLERAAQLLDATGFIVWLADDDGQHLRPSLAHGYRAPDAGAAAGHSP